MIARLAVAYVGAALAVLGLDSVWLTLTNAIYRADLGPMLAKGFKPAPAVAFYVLYIAGLTVLVIGPALARSSIRQAAWRGALFGLVSYGTYDLTNQATLVVWHTSLTLMDMTWGAVLSAVGASVGYWAASRIKSQN